MLAKAIARNNLVKETQLILVAPLDPFAKSRTRKPRSMNTRGLTERAATVRVAPHEHFSPPSLEVNLFKNVAEFWLQMAKGYAKQ